MSESSVDPQNGIVDAHTLTLEMFVKNADLVLLRLGTKYVQI